MLNKTAKREMKKPRISGIKTLKKRIKKDPELLVYLTQFGISAINMAERNEAMTMYEGHWENDVWVIEEVEA